LMLKQMAEHLFEREWNILSTGRQILGTPREVRRAAQWWGCHDALWNAQSKVHRIVPNEA